MTLDGRDCGSGSFWLEFDVTSCGAGDMHGSPWGDERPRMYVRYQDMAYWGYGDGVDAGDCDGDGYGYGDDP